MVGKPITYKSDDKKLLEKITDTFLYNDEIDTNTTLAQEQSICGYAYELIFTDEDAMVRFKCIDTENMIVVYDSTLEGNILFAILYSSVKDEETTMYIYDKENEYKATLKYGSISNLDEGTPHNFMDVPVNTYENNRQRRGDFEKHISIIDAIKYIAYMYSSFRTIGFLLKSSILTIFTVLSLFLLSFGSLT